MDRASTGRGGAPRQPLRVLVPALLAAALTVGAARPLAAGPLGEPGAMNPDIPSPESVLGYPLGTQFTPHHLLVAYLQALAEASPRVELTTYGRTPEGRPLLLLTVSDPENLAHQDAIRASYARLSDPRHLAPDAARKLAGDLPVAVWLSFNIHGNEASSSEAAMALAYELAAAQDDSVQQLLHHAVVLIDPCLNPDGRDRYVNWVRGVTGSSPDPLPQSLEHSEPWPGGRYNHYLFDLNRDWAWLVQPESRARAKIYLSWSPQVHVDFHEMWPEETYFFFPPVPPINALFPRRVTEWSDIFGRANAAAFDARGWRYFTREAFDLYYPGYGDSWPTFQGAIGMTYEQAGGRPAGTAFLRADGDTLTLHDRALHHYVAARTTIRTAVAHRTDRLMDFYRFFEPSAKGGPAAFYFPPGSDPPRTAELVDLLLAHGAEVFRARSALRPSGLHAYDGKTTASSLPEGTYVVRMDQPRHRFLQAILEPEAALPDTFFYDVSAWSLPLAFGIRAYWSEGPANGPLDPVQSPPHVTGTVSDRDAAYAYLISWSRNNAAKAASWLQARHVRVHYTAKTIRTGGERFPPGSLVVFRNGNPADLPGLMEEAASETGIDVVGVETGLTDGGPDLGSSFIHFLPRPRVAVVVDRPVEPTSAGACWYLFDRLYHIPYSLVRLGDLSAQTLSRYSVVVFPDDGAGGNDYAAAVDSSTVEMLRTWIRGGGVFVGLGGGAFFAAADEVGLASVRKAPPDEEDEDASLSGEDKTSEDTDRRLETEAERARRKRLDVLPGTIFRIEVDPQQPVGYGYTGQARVLKINDNTLELGPPGTNPAWFTASPKVSGYATPEAVHKLAGSPFVVDEPLGRGHVVLYVEDPNFRLFWYGLTKLFLNSLFFLSPGGGA